MGPAQPAANDFDLGGRAEGARPRKTEQMGPQGDVLAVADALRSPIERGQPKVPGSGTGEEERGGRRGEPRGADGPQQARADGGDEEHQTN